MLVGASDNLDDLEDDKDEYVVNQRITEQINNRLNAKRPSHSEHKPTHSLKENIKPPPIKYPNLIDEDLYGIEVGYSK